MSDLESSSASSNHDLPDSESSEDQTSHSAPTNMPPPPQFSPISPPISSPGSFSPGPPIHPPHDEPDSDNNNVGPPSDLPPPPMPPTPSVDELPSKFYKAIYDYNNPDKDENTLTLRVGDILIILETKADGWWKAQLGSEVGLFPATYCEPISEDEVKAFIANSNKGKKSPAPPGQGRIELQKEMKSLQEEEAALSAQSAALKAELQTLKDESKKMRKKIREDLLETFDTLPSCVYQISRLTYAKFNLIKTSTLINKIVDSDSDRMELLPKTIETCTAFVDEVKHIADPKMKLELDRIVSKVLAVQKSYLDELANINVDLLRSIVGHLDSLASHVSELQSGKLELSPEAFEAAATSPRINTPSTSKKEKDKKVKKSKDKTKDGEKEKKKKKDNDAEPKSPRRKTRMIQNAEVDGDQEDTEEQGSGWVAASPPMETLNLADPNASPPISPRSPRDKKKSKKTKVEETEHTEIAVAKLPEELVVQEDAEQL